MQIRIKTGPNKGKLVPVTGAHPIVIGRDNSCGLQVIDRGVSREHAKIVRVGEMVFLHDLGSRNGSYVNGERVKEELLREGDIIRVGATQLQFESVRHGRRSEDDLQYDENDDFKSSLELNIKDLYVTDDTADREIGHFKAICRATHLFQVERDEKTLLDKLLDLMIEYVPAVHAYIFLRDEASGKVVPQAIKRKADSHTAPVSRSILRKVIGEAKAILTADAMQDERFKSGDSIITHSIRSLICVPITGSGHVHGAIYAVNSSLTEAFDESDLQLATALGSQLALALENLHQTVRRRKVYFRIIGRLISTLEGMKFGEPGHSERVSGFCTAIAIEMGLSDRELVQVSLAGLLHDIGKIRELSGAPAAVGQMASGSGNSSAVSDILTEIPDLPDTLACIHSQYENYDGTGFPNQLKGDAIPLGGRIVSVASAFDKLIYPGGAPTAHTDGTAVRDAFMYLEQRAAAMYDPEAVKALMVSYRHGALSTLKPASARLAETKEGEPADDLPAAAEPLMKGTRLRKTLEPVSKLNTIRMDRMDREGYPAPPLPDASESPPVDDAAPSDLIGEGGDTSPKKRGK